MLPFSNQGPQKEGVTVIGEATRTAQPEIVELSLDVHSAAPLAAQALRDNAAKVMQIGQAVTSMGVAQQDLQAGAATVYPIFQPPFGGPENPFLLQAPRAAAQLGAPAAGYHVVSFLKLSFSDVGRLGDLVDAATMAGAAVSGGFLFRMRDEGAIRRELLEQAGKNAREKAGALATSVGKALGDPVSVMEDFSAWQFGWDGHQSGPFALTPSGTLARMPFTPGELSFHARVSVTFRMQ